MRPTIEMIAAARNQRERERLEAWRELGSCAEAAIQLGCGKSTLRRAMKTVCDKLGIDPHESEDDAPTKTGKGWDTRMGFLWLTRAL